MTQTMVLKVGGMTCGHCARTVETAARRVAGVEEARVDLARGELSVRGSAAREAIAAAVNATGYEA